jgi:hypothetical protein
MGDSLLKKRIALCLTCYAVQWMLQNCVGAWIQITSTSNDFHTTGSQIRLPDARYQFRNISPRYRMKSTILFAEKAKLTFTANFDVTSDKLPSDSYHDAYAFFMTKQFRNHLLSSGGKSFIQEVEVDDTLQQMWEEASETWSGIETSPNLENGDCVVASETSLDFPSLKLLNTVYSGVKCLIDINGKPYYTCVSIADKRTPVGPAPVVWLYNKLTGSNTTTEYSPPGGRAKSVITIDEINDGHAIRFQAEVQIIVEFPKLLMKLLPASKEKLEHDGSVSVYKSLNKQIQHGIESIVDNFQLWKETGNMEIADT